MKWTLALLAIGLLFATLIVIAPVGADGDGPEAILYGKDACAHCRMMLARPGFAGEMRARTGKLTKYDDVGCLLRAVWAEHAEVPQAWVEDHDSGALLPLLDASFVVDSSDPTPMGYGVLAFESPKAAERFAARRGGKPTTLEALLADGARFRHSTPGE